MEIPWKLEITKVENGYLLEWGDEASDNPQEVIYHRAVIEEREEDPLYHHEALLWTVQEHFDFFGSKHDRERLIVERRRNGENQNTKKAKKG